MTDILAASGASQNLTYCRDELLRSLDRAIDDLRSVGGLPRPVEADAIWLAVAAKRGRLRAVRRTDQWYSTEQWVHEYKESRYKRGWV